MKFRFVFGFILLILASTSIFVAAPYLLQIIKSNQIFNFSLFNFSRFISTSTPGYFYRKPQPLISQPQPQPVGRISISSVYRSGQGQINLSAAYFKSDPVDITGWKIKSFQRGEIIIGKGLALPQFNSFLSDIRLESGGSVKIIAGASPLSSSFQINSCFGWLNNVYNIDSALNYCPLIQISDLIGFGLNSACQDLILNSGSCRAPSDTDLNNYSRECRIWVEQNLNYNVCVEKYINKSDFYKDWRIYTGNDTSFYDQLHDRIELRDRAGLLVDSDEY
ncbi:MAG: hypothetical protein AAB789_01825 [Patescibacteria group bacterium]